MKMKKYSSQFYLNSAIQIANMLDKLPNLTGWTSDEYYTIKKLLISGIYANLKATKQHIYSDYEEKDND